MYYLIGVDGNQYGPVAADVLRQWITQGRANAQSRVRFEGAGDWKPLSEFPEFAADLRSATSLGAPPSPTPVLPENARTQVNGPAIGLMVTALVYAGFGLIGLLTRFLGASTFMFRRGMHPDVWVGMMSGTAGVLVNLVGLVIAGVVLFGALKMQQLENHSLAVLASILAILPCTSPCCVIGIPMGIWALVVLNRPEVKSAFR